VNVHSRTIAPAAFRLFFPCPRAAVALGCWPGRGIIKMRIMGIVALSVTMSSLAAAQNVAPHPNSIAAQLAGPWHHVPNAVSPDRYARDQAKCRMIAGQTPEINDIKFSVVLINCLRAEGYEPGAAPNVEQHSFASTRFDDYSCADIAKLKKKSASVDLLFLPGLAGLSVDGTHLPRKAS
jgi:hypothetical protein